MKNILLHIYIGGLVVTAASLSHAQETTASGNLQNEASWSALKSLIGKTQGEVDIVEVDVNAIKNCSKQGKIYNGTTCVGVTVPTDPRITSIITCGNQGRVYSQAQNTCIEVAGSARWVHIGSGPSDSPHRGTSSTSGINRKLNEAGIPKCSSTLLLGQKCSPAGSSCAMIDQSERNCGSQGDYTCVTYSTRIFKCN